MSKCPRQDPNNLKIADVFEIACPGCGEKMEFFKDEQQRKCPQCGQMIDPEITQDK